MKLNSLAVFLIVGLAASLASYTVFQDTYLEFDKDAPVATILFGYGALAFLIERLVSVILANENREIQVFSERHQLAREKVRNASLWPSENRGVLQDGAEREVTESLEQLQRVEDEKSPKFQFWSLIAGVIVAAMGFRVFDQLTVVAGGELDSKSIATFIHYFADIILSGTLLSGGSTLVDNFQKLFRR